MRRNTMRRVLALLMSALCLCVSCVPALAEAGSIRVLQPGEAEQTAGLALLDPAQGTPEGFVRVDLLIPDVVLDIRYAGSNNFVGNSIDGYEAPVALLTRQAAEALAKVADAVRPMGLRLCIYDAYRPESAVEHFARWAQDADDIRMKDLFYPAVRKQSLFDKGYIAKRSSHSRGSCVDVTLVDAAGAPLDMGGSFDLFSPVSAHGAKGLTGMQQMNRKLLRAVMEKQGFKSYNAEWWHYTLKEEPFPKRSFSFPVRERVKITGISRYIANQFYNTTSLINIPPKIQGEHDNYYQRYYSSSKSRMENSRSSQESVSASMVTTLPPKEVRLQAMNRGNPVVAAPNPLLLEQNEPITKAGG